MAINFPNAPVNGTTYDYLGVRYTWKDTGGGTGFWAVNSAGSYGGATSIEVNTGTDTVKYISPEALNGSDYARKTSPVFTGTPTAPTPGGADNSTRLATTAYVTSKVTPLAPLASPTFTGTPLAPTATAGTNTTQLATTAFVTTAIANKTNVATADRWTTSRSLTLTGDASGSASFNGSANASITVVVADNSHNHSASNINSGTLASARLPVATTSARGAVFHPQFSASQNGYWRCVESGFYLQWGRGTISSGASGVTQSFPIAFPTVCYSVLVTSTHTATKDANMYVSSISRTSFFTKCPNTAMGFTFIATGK